MTDSIFKGVAFIQYMVKQLFDLNPNKQIGKTVIQKMFYLLSRKGTVSLDYSMYHYGPFSGQISSELNFAEHSNAVKIEWKMDEGYWITPGGNEFDSNLNDDEIKSIDEIINKYGSLNAVDLSIVATAFFGKDNFDIKDKNDLIRAVSDLKTDYSENKIKQLIEKYVFPEET
jgi:uncharacterized protein